MSAMITASEFATLLKAKKTGPRSWMAKCPSHDDHRDSLSIGEGDDQPLILNCFAGCDFESIMKAAGVEPAKPNGKANGKDKLGPIVATYDYHDAAGKLVFQVVRFESKDFRQRAASGEWSVKGIEKVPYRLPQLLNANEVYICEGEKDCNNLVKLGLMATTNPGGADADGEGGKKWPEHFARWFDGRHVMLLPDNDDPGRRHVQAVARKLASAAASIKILALPGLPDKGDVSDWLASGGTAQKLQELAAAAPYAHPCIINSAFRLSISAPTSAGSQSLPPASAAVMVSITTTGSPPSALATAAAFLDALGSRKLSDAVINAKGTSLIPISAAAATMRLPMPPWPSNRDVDHRLLLHAPLAVLHAGRDVHKHIHDDGGLPCAGLGVGAAETAGRDGALDDLAPVQLGLEVAQQGIGEGLARSVVGLRPVSFLGAFADGAGFDAFSFPSGQRYTSQAPILGQRERSGRVLDHVPQHVERRARLAAVLLAPLGDVLIIEMFDHHGGNGIAVSIDA